jgi:hypothetical protein
VLLFALGYVAGAISMVLLLSLLAAGRSGDD